MSRTSACCLVVLAVCLAGSAEAIVGDRMGDIGLDGSLRTITGASVNYDYPLLFEERADGFSQTILRFELGGEPADWLKFEVHGVQDLNLSTSGEGFGGALFGGGTVSRYRLMDAAWDWGDEPSVKARLWLDRANLRFRAEWFDLTVGRQAITFGKAYFWNPLDVYLAFDPRSFDRDYKPGVDAVRLDIPLGMVSGITLVGVLGRDNANGVDGTLLSHDPETGQVVGLGFGGSDVSWLGSSILARAYTTLWDWDFAVQGGKTYGGYLAGLAASGEIWQIEVRAEGAYFISDDEDVVANPTADLGVGEWQVVPDHFVGVVGLGHHFEFDLTVEAEYLYNGAGDDDDLGRALSRVAAGRSFHMSEHLLGVMLDYEIMPILHSTLTWLFSISDQSSLIQPGLSYSVSDEADFIAGAMIALGARPTSNATTASNPLGLESEFGTYPNFYYMEFKFYF